MDIQKSVHSSASSSPSSLVPLVPSPSTPPVTSPPPPPPQVVQHLLPSTINVSPDSSTTSAPGDSPVEEDIVDSHCFLSAESETALPASPPTITRAPDTTSIREEVIEPKKYTDAIDAPDDRLEAALASAGLLDQQIRHRKKRNHGCICAGCGRPSQMQCYPFDKLQACLCEYCKKLAVSCGLVQKAGPGVGEREGSEWKPRQHRPYKKKKRWGGYNGRTPGGKLPLKDAFVEPCDWCKRTNVRKEIHTSQGYMCGICRYHQKMGRSKRFVLDRMTHRGLLNNSHPMATSPRSAEHALQTAKTDTSLPPRTPQIPLDSSKRTRYRYQCSWCEINFTTHKERRPEYRQCFTCFRLGEIGMTIDDGLHLLCTYPKFKKTLPMPDHLVKIYEVGWTTKNTGSIAKDSTRSLPVPQTCPSPLPHDKCFFCLCEGPFDVLKPYPLCLQCLSIRCERRVATQSTKSTLSY